MGITRRRSRARRRLGRSRATLSGQSAIAVVSSRPGLYFEVRQGTKPVNPRSWVSRQPKTWLVRMVTPDRRWPLCCRYRRSSTVARKWRRLFLEHRMSLKTRGILVLVIGSILGVSLSVGGNMLAGRDSPSPRELTWEQARLLTEVMERVQKRLRRTDRRGRAPG